MEVYWEPEYDISGNELVQAPAVTIHVGAEYTTQLSNISISRIDYYWQDDFYSQEYIIIQEICGSMGCTKRSNYFSIN